MTRMLTSSYLIGRKGEVLFLLFSLSLSAYGSVKAGAVDDPSFSEEIFL